MTIEIKGNWKKGPAFDVHTLSSTYLGVWLLASDLFDQLRSNILTVVVLDSHKIQAFTPHLFSPKLTNQFWVFVKSCG